jgi:hypothetical protein
MNKGVATYSRYGDYKNVEHYYVRIDDFIDSFVEQYNEIPHYKFDADKIYQCILALDPKTSVASP